MKIFKAILAVSIVCTCGSAGLAQKAKPTPAPKTARPVVFAVLQDGKTLEPIAYINKGKLEAAPSGADEPGVLTAFHRSYYKPKASYSLIFGAADAGSVTIRSANAKADCQKNMAQVTTRAEKTPLKGLVMGLATNGPVKTTATSFRRKPTPTEKEEIEALVRAEFTKHKLTPQTLRYHNLTALDLENDGKPEFVGSYWVEIDKLTRGLLFFIAGQGASGKYSFGYQEYRSVDQNKVMSNQIKDVDDGVYHELLLDAYDFDEDGTSNIFTYVQSFEGAGFNAYSRSGGKWVKSFDGSNYHCAY